MTEYSKKPLGNVVQIDEKRINDHLGELVRGTVEETLNGLLDAEADALCGEQRYERSPERTDYRVGSYDRKLHTKAGEVTLKMPKLRKQAFETAIVERYRRRESSIEEMTASWRSIRTRTRLNRCWVCHLSWLVTSRPSANSHLLIQDSTLGRLVKSKPPS